MTSKEQLALLKIEIAAQILSALACNPEADISGEAWANIACDNAERIVNRFLNKLPAKVTKLGTKDAVKE